MRSVHQAQSRDRKEAGAGYAGRARPGLREDVRFREIVKSIAVVAPVRDVRQTQSRDRKR